MSRIFCVVLIVVATQVLAQSAIPGGTILPVRLDTSLNSRREKVGQVISARVMQDVPLPSGKIRAGAKVLGRVENVVNVKGGERLTIRFDTVAISKRRIPVTTNLRAIASMMAVEEAQIPTFGPDRGTPADWATTEQIGGEVVYRGGGPVVNGLRSVGKPAPNGVLVHVSAGSETKCRGDVEGNGELQALWLFSSDACGAYGFSGLTIAHAGRTNPVGEITLASERDTLNVRGGSGMLLRVITRSSE